MTRPAKITGACPECGETADPAFRPFCSLRCARLDLSRWLNEQYRIPATEDDDEADESDPSDTTH